MFAAFKIVASSFLFLLFNLRCSAFTIEELKAINYEVDILSTMPMMKGEKPSDPVLRLTSIFGQEYQCFLPHIEEEEVSEKVTYSEKNTDINELLKPINGHCLLKAKDWWTYELCFGQHIKQFHIEDGQIIGQVLILGLYESDYDWNNETDQEKFRHVKQRYHSQYYVNGTKCDLTGQPRTAEIRIFCEEDSGDYIQRVDEPGTCNYVITVHTARACSHPHLKPLPSKKAHLIPCHPLLNEEQYGSYIEKINEEKALADQKMSQWLNTQQERLQVMKKDSDQKMEEIVKNLVEELPSTFLDDLAVNKLDKSNEEQIPIGSLDPEEELVEELDYNTDDDDEEEDVESLLFQQYDKELEKLKSFTTPEKFAAMKSNIQEFFDSVLKDAVEEENPDLAEEDKEDAYTKLTTTLNTLLKKLDKAEKDVVEVTKNLNKAKSAVTEATTDASVTDDDQNSELKTERKTNPIKNEIGTNEEIEFKAGSLLDESEEENNDEFQVRIRRLDRANSNGQLYEIDRVQQKKLEQAIKEKLEKYGVNTGGRKIEVKIIKAGYYGNQLSDTEASQFENMITALLTGEQEAIQEMERNKKLEENYKFTWDSEIDDEEEEVEAD